MNVWEAIYFVVACAISVGLGFVTANMAKKKGYGFGLWFFLGFMCGCIPIPLIIICVMPNKNSSPKDPAETQFEELDKQYARGKITDDEYIQQRNEIIDNL